MRYSYMKNGETLALDVSACSGCGACLEVCPHGVFVLEGGKASVAGREFCMECGACARNCPSRAIAVEAGVGCAGAIIRGKLFGTAPTCGEDAAAVGGSSKGACCGESGKKRSSCGC
jgi:NAD-dependent dihydropyrimidine dehydrogenase PreA subunit